jgi:hypothetical protein
MEKPFPASNAFREVEVSMSILGRSFVGRLIPEVDWQQLSSAGYDEIYKGLAAAGGPGQATADYLKHRRVKLGFGQQDESGGGWTLLHNITLAPAARLADAYTVSLIVHEVFHLRQSILLRLSVCGELLAWQYQRQAYREAAGRELGDPGAAFAGKRGLWDELAGLSADRREDLARAQQLMKTIAEGYRSECLPLYPLHKEIGHHLRQREIRESFGVIRNLFTCR